MTRLSHYTDRVGLEGIAKTGTLWATNFMEVNDTSEYFYAWTAVQRGAMTYALARVPNDLKLAGVSLDSIVTETTEALRKLLKSSSDGYGHLYMTSFARAMTKDQERRGILTLWDRYTDHKGYCLQFDKSDIERKLNGELMKGNYVSAGLSEVKYGIDEESREFKELCVQFGEHLLVQMARVHGGSRIHPDYQNHWALSALIRKLMDYCATRKDPCFEDERELRIFVYPADRAEARGFTGIAGRKEIQTAPSGKRFLALGEYWRPGIIPRRIIIGTKADPNLASILAMYDHPPEIAYANMPVA